MRQTSLQAYEDIILDGSSATQRMEILHFLRRFADGLTRQEISEMMTIPINAVCGRIKELLKTGSVFEDGRKRNKHTGKNNMVIKASSIKIYDEIDYKIRRGEKW